MKKKSEKIIQEEVEFYHPTVLLKEVVENFVKNKNGIYVDATCGGGGHSLALLESYPDIKLIASDWDLNAIKATENRLRKYSDRVTIIQSAFSHIKDIINKSGYKKVDGILVDFGTSRHQIKHSDGFSFLIDSPLDMRMSKGHGSITAASIVNHSTEKELEYILINYGEEYNAKKIAKKIIEERSQYRIKTTLELAKIIEKIIPRRGKIHPATKTFQGLRITINKEIEQIESLLHHVPDLLNDKGSIACISFQSIEDRSVKNFYKKNKNNFDINNIKIISPSFDEIKINPSSRSAKMRILYKKS